MLEREVSRTLLRWCTHSDHWRVAEVRVPEAQPLNGHHSLDFIIITALFEELLFLFP